MRLSLNWLGRYIKVPEDTAALAERLTMTGSKVELTERLGGDIEKVVVGRVLDVTKHPDADKLVVCTVDVGAGENVSIVTGATNVTPGATVPVALDGSRLPGGKTIKAGKLRGVLSQGMLCSFQELGLTQQDEPYADGDGILVFTEKDGAPIPAPGTPVQTALDLTDTVLEFEITNNRPDCLSVIGLARETAAAMGLALNKPTLNVRAGHGSVGDEVKVSIQDTDLCARYTARMVKNVKVGSSPRWLRRLLRASGLRPINNIVDITNYVLLEYGQPLHSFDFSCVKGGEIIVRRARAGEVMDTLDGQARTLTPDMLVIADAERPVAVAGVMGGLNSEITESTQTVLFESANFNGLSVRRTAMALNMRTDASSRFEKGLDATATKEAADRACELVELLGCGEVLDGYVDAYPTVPQAREIAFTAKRISAHIGMEIPADEQIRYLEAVGCRVEGGDAGTLTAKIPTWRADLLIWQDLSEEVARLYGYDRIVSTQTESRCTGVLTPAQKARLKAKALLRGFGYDEMLTYSFAGQSDYDLIAMPENHELRSGLSIINPLGEETSSMRTTALPALARSLARNVSARNPEALLFEVATTYHPVEGALPEERENLVFGGFCKGLDFFALKGHIETLLVEFRVKDAVFTPQTGHFAFHPGRCAEVSVNGVYIGVFGQLHPTVCEAVSATAFAAELRFGAILSCASPEGKYIPLPRFPAVTRDLALLSDESVPQADIQSAVRMYGGKLLTDCRLFDVYRGANIPEGRKSVAYSLTFRADDRTLTDEEVDKNVARLLKQLEQRLGLTLR